ncbi:uncharacterized protein LOC142354168 [Convolutriloba macropyga]|uniref:uncharacterized protein LOC142354168 n=1 Tax=Convolutriloba macropyga TaxID=536237 RepID=UPI003F51FD70
MTKAQKSQERKKCMAFVLALILILLILSVVVVLCILFIPTDDGSGSKTSIVFTRHLPPPHNRFETQHEKVKVSECPSPSFHHTTETHLVNLGKRPGPVGPLSDDGRMMMDTRTPSPSRCLDAPGYNFLEIPNPKDPNTARCLFGMSELASSIQDAQTLCRRKYPASVLPFPHDYDDARLFFDAMENDLNPLHKRFLLGFIRDEKTDDITTGWYLYMMKDIKMSDNFFSPGEPNNAFKDEYCSAVDANINYDTRCANGEEFSVVCQSDAYFPPSS